MNKIIKTSDSTTLKLKELMNALKEIGCNSEEKLNVRKIFKIYLEGKAEITNPLCRNYYLQYYLLLDVKEFIDMKKLSKEQIIEQLEDGIEQLKNILSEATIENEQERIIRKNRIIAKLERENEILRTKLEEVRKG